MGRAEVLIALVSNVETVIKAREEIEVGATQAGTDWLRLGGEDGRGKC